MRSSKHVTILGLLLWSFIFVISCKSNEVKNETSSGELLIQVYEERAVDDLEEAFKSYDLKKMRVVSRPVYIYLFSFNTQSIDQEELLVLVKESTLVKEAQTNKSVQIRN